jgi:hypothetical protein
MSRILPLTSMLLLTVAFAMAKSSNTTNSQISKAVSANAKQETIQGCLAGADGNYTLTDSQGRIWQLEGSTDQLKGGVGHTVAITGRGNNGAVVTGNSKEYIDVDMASVNDFQVSSVRQISVGCSVQSRRYARRIASDMLAAE